MEAFLEAMELAGAVLITGIVVGFISLVGAHANEYSGIKTFRMANVPAVICN